MREHPIPFTAAMVQAIDADLKTQTRRLVKPQPTEAMWDIARANLGGDTYRAKPAVGIGGIGLRRDDGPLAGTGFVEPNIRCPYGRAGDRLWVKESYRFGRGYDGLPPRDAAKSPNARVHYEADGPAPVWAGKLRPGMFMVRSRARLLLTITEIRVERLNDISTHDCWAEGIPASPDVDPRHEYRELWERINGPGSWALNQWVWVVSFTKGAK